MILGEEHRIRRRIGRAEEDLVHVRRGLDLAGDFGDAVPRVGLLRHHEAELLEIGLHQQADLFLELGAGHPAKRDRDRRAGIFRLVDFGLGGLEVVDGLRDIAGVEVGEGLRQRRRQHATGRDHLADGGVVGGKRDGLADMHVVGRRELGVELEVERRRGRLP